MLNLSKKYKEIHIWDLPTDQIYIRLNEKFRISIFTKLKKLFGNDKSISKVINKKPYDISKWKRGVNACPLNSIMDLIKFIDINNFVFEKNIVMIKSGRNGNPSTGEIKNPKLPFKLTPGMAQLISHFLHDGHIRDLRATYTSKDKKILKEIVKLVKLEIGEIKKPSCSVSSFKGISILFPRIISLLLVYGFNCKVGSKIKNDPGVPPLILESDNKEVISRYLKAAFSDEGCMVNKNYTRHIVFGLSKGYDGKFKPPKLLEGSYFLIKRIGINPTRMTLYRKYKTKKGEKREGWWFRISNKEGLELFRDNIGFLQNYKNKKLNDAINSYVFK